MKYWVTKLDLHNYIQARYGNPDVQILGTLKIKLHIFRFLNITRKNMGSIFIFRVPIYSPISKSADIWEPWKLKWFQNIKKCKNSHILSKFCHRFLRNQVKLSVCQIPNKYMEPVSLSETKPRFLRKLRQNLDSICEFLHFFDVLKPF